MKFKYSLINLLKDNEVEKKMTKVSQIARCLDNTIWRTVKYNIKMESKPSYRNV